MIYIDTFLYYTLFSSILLFYGIGLNQVSEIGEQTNITIIFFLKSILSIFSTSILTYLVVAFILLPLELIEIFPIICLLIFVTFNSFAEGLVRLTTGTSTTEFLISFLIVLISIFQSSSILDTMVICFSCISGILLLIPFINVLKNKITNKDNSYVEKNICTFLILVAILILIISVFDVSWMNRGIIK